MIARLPAWGFCAAVMIGLADQGTKQIVRASLDYGEIIPITGFFNLTHHYNRGAAFGLFASGSTALLAFGVVATIVLSVLLWRSRHHRWSAAAFAAMLGGAIGNLVDRFRHSAVVDWLDFHFSGWHWPAFNVADIALTVGVALYLFGDLRRGTR